MNSSCTYSPPEVEEVTLKMVYDMGYRDGRMGYPIIAPNTGVYGSTVWYMVGYREGAEQTETEREPPPTDQ